MHDDDYPDWICSPCAYNAGGKVKGQIITCHYNICDICNEFTSVSEPRDYGYPKVKSNFNKAKILGELEYVKSIYIKEGNISAANELDERIIHYRFCK